MIAGDLAARDEARDPAPVTARKALFPSYKTPGVHHAGRQSGGGMAKCRTRTASGAEAARWRAHERGRGRGSRPHRGHWTAWPDLVERRSSRLVATATGRSEASAPPSTAKPPSRL